MTHLRINAACVRFGSGFELGPISLNINLSGITALLGPNGAGKSLFLCLCHGTLDPTSGTVEWDGQDPVSTRRNRGFMLQTSVILRRTVADNIGFALQSHGEPRQAQFEKTRHALRQARLLEKADAPAATLSGGELRRMNLARALVTVPQVLLLDEPFAGLDPAATQEMETIIQGIAVSTPVLMSHHDLVQTRRMATQVIFFSNGQMAENALAADFFLQPKSTQADTFIKGRFL
jgi:tungstate transport system ATP-binding protein